MIGEDVRKTRMLGEKGYGCYANTENTGAIGASLLVLNKRCYTVSRGALTKISNGDREKSHFSPSPSA